MTAITIPACPKCGSASDWISREPTERGDVLSHLDPDGWTRTKGPAGTTVEETLDIQIECAACGFDTGSDEKIGEEDGLWSVLANNPASPRNS